MTHKTTAFNESMEGVREIGFCPQFLSKNSLDSYIYTRLLSAFPSSLYTRLLSTSLPILHPSYPFRFVVITVPCAQMSQTCTFLTRPLSLNDPAVLLSPPKMDMMFSMPIHQDPHTILSIVDEVWAAETLPIEDIIVPANAVTNVDDDDPSSPNEYEDENKWNDLGLEELNTAASSNSAPQHIVRTNTATSSPHGR